MKPSKPLTMFMALLLVLPLMFSCGNDSGGQSATDIPVSTAAGEVETSTEAKILPDLPENLNLEGFKFRLLYNNKVQQSDWGVDGIYAESENSEVINDAAYIRNKTLEEKYNFVIVPMPMSTDNLTASYVQKIVMAGSDEFDCVIMRQNSIAQLITSHLLLDIGSLPYVDLDKPWWDKSIMQQLSIGNKYYTGFGDLIVTANNALRVILFNKDLIKQLNLEMPYDMVKNNTWTLDKLAEMSRNVYLDANGNAEMDVEDRYGFLAQSSGPIVLLEGTGEDTTSKNSSDLPVITIGTERTIAAMELIGSIFSQKDVVLMDTMFAKIYPGTEYKGLQDTFEANRGLFFCEVLQLAERMRATDVNMGILPLPKLDANQKDYYAYADSWCMNHIVVPVTNTNLEKTGQVLEALNAESMYTIVPAYYDKSLNGKFMRDNESSEMLDIILENKRVSMDEMFNWGLYNTINTALKGATGQYASTIEKNIAKTEKAVQKTIDTMTDE